jgi:hypothetical protein
LHAYMSTDKNVLLRGGFERCSTPLAYYTRFSKIHTQRSKRHGFTDEAV